MNFTTFARGVTVAAVVLVTGCSTSVPVQRTFPAVPQELNTACAELKTIEPGTTRLSGVISVVSENYADYHLCSERVLLWQEWYQKQREIFDSVK